VYILYRYPVQSVGVSVGVSAWQSGRSPAENEFEAIKFKVEG